MLDRVLLFFDTFYTFVTIVGPNLSFVCLASTEPSVCQLDLQLAGYYFPRDKFHSCPMKVH